MTELDSEIEKQFERADQFLKAENYASAFEIYKVLSDEGWAECDTILGWMYGFGKGTEVDFELAEKFFLRPAKKGDEESQFYLGKLYVIKGDFQSATFWLEKAAFSKYSPAFHRLGCLYSNQRYEIRNEERAFNYFEKASQLGHISGQIRLAYKLIRGFRGWLRIPKGICLLIQSIISALILSSKNIHDDRLHY